MIWSAVGTRYKGEFQTIFKLSLKRRVKIYILYWMYIYKITEIVIFYPNLGTPRFKILICLAYDYFKSYSEWIVSCNTLLWQKYEIYVIFVYRINGKLYDIINSLICIFIAVQELFGKKIKTSKLHNFIFPQILIKLSWLFS